MTEPLSNAREQGVSAGLIPVLDYISCSIVKIVTESSLDALQDIPIIGARVNAL